MCVYSHPSFVQNTKGSMPLLHFNDATPLQLALPIVTVHADPVIMIMCIIQTILNSPCAAHQKSTQWDQKHYSVEYRRKGCASLVATAMNSFV